MPILWQLLRALSKGWRSPAVSVARTMSEVAPAIRSRAIRSSNFCQAWPRRGSSSASIQKLAVAANHGADHLVDYQADDLVARVRDLTGGEGADVVFDPVGGDAFDNAIRCIAFGGRLVVIGFTSGRIPSASAGRILIKGCAVLGSSWTAIWQRQPAVVRRAFNDLARWHTAGALRPEIDRRMPFAQAADALRLLAERKVAGKIVLTVDGQAL